MSFNKLKYALQHNSKDIEKAVDQYQTFALSLCPTKPRRVVYIMSDEIIRNDRLCRELENNCVSVFRCPVSERQDYIEQMFAQETCQVLAIVREETVLNVLPAPALETKMHINHKNADGLVTYVSKSFSVPIRTNTPISPRTMEGEWMKNFKPGNATPFNLFELKQMGMHATPRDFIIDWFIDNFVKCEEVKVIDFKSDIIGDSFDCAVEKFKPFVQKAIFYGIFYQSKSLQPKHPSFIDALNAGVVGRESGFPLIQSISSFVIPELVLNGNNDPRLDDVFMTHELTRMAIANILSDYVYIELISGSRDNPLWKLCNSCNITLLNQYGGFDLVDLKLVMWANVVYWNTGSTIPWIDLGASEETLCVYMEHYNPKTLEHYEKALRKLSFAKLNTTRLKDWWKKANQFEYLNVTTVEEFAAGIELDHGADNNMKDIFNYLFEVYIDSSSYKAFTFKGDHDKAYSRWSEGRTVFESDTVKRAKAFSRWAAGQLTIFMIFEMLVGGTRAHTFEKRFLNHMLVFSKEPTNENMGKVRKEYDTFLLLLSNEYLLSQEKLKVFAERFQISSDLKLLSQ